MPQIAQQDYIVIKPKEGRAAKDDAECLRRLKLACENGTIFDCLVGYVTEDGSLDRVLGIYEDGISIMVSDITNEANASILLPYTPTQYSGLAAVQEAEDEYFGEAMSELPRLYRALGYLNESVGGLDICVNGFKLSATASGGILTALEISDTKPEEGGDFINIAWEDALKLIGLPVA